MSSQARRLAALAALFGLLLERQFLVELLAQQLLRVGDAGFRTLSHGHPGILVAFAPKGLTSTVKCAPRRTPTITCSTERVENERAPTYQVRPAGPASGTGGVKRWAANTLATASFSIEPSLAAAGPGSGRPEPFQATKHTAITKHPKRQIGVLIDPKQTPNRVPRQLEI